ncbi:MAG: aspartate carbamoyltransferase catalytic subunit [Paenibacillus dendritiformis]|uniref:aspartate carbamoyltransferase catalytic subunit n=1 Tax=Paenibacillus dendritiformis TaxID=130049 RepID=UPI00143DF783|nr:aspartate carbamoyltransferase catalytic subunit [Paenibacillus dendritiformis]MDU5143174.1 aspartate carbamoyltransferase catalytic subunit [Paenibacillus dendritiformis]NKI20730.1 aspartate carbamoyltransferase catalytic subunit [Paenibacillus dendritiformis]NRF96792.1 aspartate carbamoyltransferase catalytic subunit [Paenibacillus dendritiformis]GIO72416.1 aspartate carbamoyltransferase [Paenibacillus dendritiformis]
MAVVHLERSLKERSLLGLKEMSKQEMESILDRADYWNRQPIKVSHVLKDKFATNLFFESSTRTRCSFEVAEKRLGAEVINFTAQASSVEKGESIYDTVRTLESMGMDAGVIRLKPVGLLEQIAERVKMPLVNAGDGNNEHPTQALLDMYTMRKHFGELSGLNVAIVGDIQHSRVARSNLWALRKFGANVSFCAPEHMRANDLDAPYISIEEAVQADVVMMLRLQLERHEGDKAGPAEQYRAQYGLTLERVAGMKPHSIIMHPAPVNRNVEIDDAVVECEQARIFDQMANGVPVRMAVMERAMA